MAIQNKAMNTAKDLYDQQQWACLSAMGDYQRQKYPLAGIDIRSIPMDELESLIEIFTKEYHRRTMHTPMQGPTRAELESNPALKEAWEAMMIIKKLQGE